MIDQSKPFPARLNNAWSPYAFVEVTPEQGGQWSDLDGGRSGVAYEANGRPGLQGNIVEVFWTSAGDYRFYGPAPGI